MVVIRNVFRLKFGKTRDALALIKESVAIQKRSGVDFAARILTDVTGPFYTVVLELTVPSVGTLKRMRPGSWAAKSFRRTTKNLCRL